MTLSERRGYGIRNGMRRRVWIGVNGGQPRGVHVFPPIAKSAMDGARSFFLRWAKATADAGKSGESRKVHPRGEGTSPMNRQGSAIQWMRVLT
jgi:hypothetical protein